MGEGFRTFDHTGDLGLEVWAPTPKRLYALAAEALLAQMVETQARDIDVRIPIDLTGADPTDLLVHWLNTALLQAELEQAVWTRAEVMQLTPTRLTGRLAGPHIRAERDVLLREVKAVSYHHLMLELSKPDCRCRLVLDI